MAVKNEGLEAKLYPFVERWIQKHFRCFKTAINVGLVYSRVDVLGVRDVGGDLSGEVESIAIEVKRGSAPFATASGQALGYQVYANRIYLAAVRPEGFEPSELDIASHLGIGLVQIKGTQCREVLSSPYHKPITRMSLQLLERMSLCQCQLCGTFFETGDVGKRLSERWSNIARENFAKALANQKGMVFWNRELGERKSKLKVRESKDGSTFERRFLCPDCIYYVFAAITAAANT